MQRGAVKGDTVAGIHFQQFNIVFSRFRIDIRRRPVKCFRFTHQRALGDTDGVEQLCPTDVIP